MTGYYATEKLGPKRAKTPEGFLLIMDAPLARTGVMYYGAGDLDPDITPGPDGIIKVLRDPDEVFSDDTIASANGKPLANEHPEENGEKVFVTPENWRKFGTGVVLNPRRGAGSFSDLLLGDILVMDPETIADIEADKRELSASYDSTYVPTQQPGVWRQTKIIINHVALVDRGRCGPRCAIGDSTTTSRSADMAGKQTPAWWTTLAERIRKAAKTNDAAGLEAALGAGGLMMPDGGGPTGDEEAGGAGTHVHLHMPGAAASGAAPGGTEGHGGGSPGGAAGGAGAPAFDDATEARFKSLEDGHKAILAQLTEIAGKLNGAAAAPTGDAMEKETEEEIKEEAGEKASKAADSAPLAAVFQQVVSNAEIIHPGIAVPTFNAADKPKKTWDSICGLRRKTIEVAAATADTAATVVELNGKPLDIATMGCGDVRALFNGVAAVRKATARSAAADAARRQQDTQNPRKDIDAQGNPIGRTHSTTELAAFLDKKHGRA